MSNTELNIVVAHSFEAKPLIEMLRLKRRQSLSAYPLYQNDDGVCLVVSGMGKTSAASATAYLAGRQENESNAARAWLNIGIAGHQRVAVGEGLLANKISDRSSDLCYYPAVLFSGFNSGEIITVDKPELEYPKNAAYEMEAAGFYSTVTRIVTAELVQVFKIISDNPENHVDNIDLASIGNWIRGQREQILSLIGQLAEATANFNGIYQVPSVFFELNAKGNFSSTQQVQLKRMCQRYIALGLQTELQRITEISRPGAKQIISQLESGLANRV